MTSSSEMFLDLQRVYHEKSKADLAACVEFLKVKEMPQHVTLEAAIEQLTICCKNAKHMEITSIRDLADEEGTLPEDFEFELDDEDSLSPWYLAVRAAEDFRTKHGHYPGMNAKGEHLENTDDHTTWITNRMNEIVVPAKPDYKADKKFATEIVRASDSKMHTVAAFLGGIASQEIIKLLIK